jgi:hypothetical protein
MAQHRYHALYRLLNQSTYVVQHAQTPFNLIDLFSNLNSDMVKFTMERLRKGKVPCGC